MRRDVVLLWAIVVWGTFPLSVLVAAIFTTVIILTCIAGFHVMGGGSMTTLPSAMVFGMFGNTGDVTFASRCRIDGGKRYH